MYQISGIKQIKKANCVNQMDKYRETFTTWNKVATLYEEKFLDLDLYNDSYNTFCDLIPSDNPSILDIGCGPGNISKSLLSRRPDFRILGIDISINMVNLAKKNNPSARFEVLDSRDLQELKNQYEGISCGFILPYLSETDRKKLIIDCKNLLSKKGILYISFVDGERIKSGFISGSSGDRVYFYYHDLDHLLTELMEHNFEILDVIHVEYPRSNDIEIHTIVIAKNQ